MTAVDPAPRDPGAPDEVSRGARAIVLFFMSFYFLLTGGHFFSSDEIHVYQTTRSLLTAGDLSIDPMNDAVLGRDGKYYTQKGIAPSLVSIPLHMFGMVLQEYVPDSWQEVFAGQKIGPQGEWGGDITIFTVNLFNVPVTALLCALFYLLALEFQYSARAALLLALILGLSTVLCVYAKSYFHHTLVALALLAAVYLLLVGKRQDRDGPFLVAGVSLGLAILTRFEMVLLLPLFLLYAASGVSRVMRCKRTIYFAVPALASVLLYLCINKIKFDSFFLFGAPARTFSGSLLVGVYGQLFSVGRSVFFYSPPLLLALFCWRRFHGRFKRETMLFVSVTIVYLIVYSKFRYWHGLWGWGNRYLLPIVPFLLLPMGILLQASLKRGHLGLRVILLATSLLGMGIQLLGATPYISSIYFAWEGAKLNPPDSYLYVPEISPPVEHWRAIVESSNIDYWLYFVYRRYGIGLAALLASPALAGLLVALTEMSRVFREALAPVVTSNVGKT